jgi:hypothetical protein
MDRKAEYMGHWTDTNEIHGRCEGCLPIGQERHDFLTLQEYADWLHKCAEKEDTQMTAVENTRKPRTFRVPVRRYVIAAAIGAAVAVGMSAVDASATNPQPDVADVVNGALDGAYDRIGTWVSDECGKGHESCSKALDWVNGAKLTYGGDMAVTWFEDGSWFIGE